MFIMGIVLSSLPLWIAQVLGLGPGPVGVIVFAMAAAMATSARLTSALRTKLGGWRAAITSLGALIAVPLLLGVWMDWGPGTALVGDPDTVAMRLQEYADVGVDTFIMSGYPHLEEAYRVAELLFPRLPVNAPQDILATEPGGEIFSLLFAAAR